MPVKTPRPASARRPLGRRITLVPGTVLVAGLLITTGIGIQDLLFNRRFHEQAELALLADVVDALLARVKAIGASAASISAMAQANTNLTPENLQPLRRRSAPCRSAAGRDSLARLRALRAPGGEGKF